MTVSVRGGGGSGSTSELARESGGDGNGGWPEVPGNTMLGGFVARRGWLETMASCRRHRTSSAEASSSGV